MDYFQQMSASDPVRMTKRAKKILARAMNAILDDPKHWDQATWHCRTSHCLAGLIDVQMGYWSEQQEHPTKRGLLLMDKYTSSVFADLAHVSHRPSEALGMYPKSPYLFGYLTRRRATLALELPAVVAECLYDANLDKAQLYRACKLLVEDPEPTLDKLIKTIARGKEPNQYRRLKVGGIKP